MEKKFSNGEIIFTEGDPGSSFYDIVSGTVGIYVDFDKESQQEMTRIGAGHIFGELALIDGLPRSATAVALDDVVLSEVQVDEYKSYFDSRPGRVTFLIKELGERMTRLTARISDVEETIKAASASDSQKEPGLFEKLSQFAKEYSMKSKFSKVSTETKKAEAMKEGEDVFSKALNTYNKGEVIFREGEPARCMYNVHTGWVDIYKGYGTPDEELISTVGVATFFGEIGLISGSVRTATAVAGIDRCMIESFTIDDFEEMYTQNPLKVQRSIEYLAERIRMLTDRYMELCEQAYDICEH